MPAGAGWVACRRQPAGRLEPSGVIEIKARLDCMHIHKQCACMNQVTIRLVEEEWVLKAKALAAKKGVSINTVIFNL